MIMRCGSGSGSIVAALTAEGLVSGKNVCVSMPGGDLYISLSYDGLRISDIFLTGPTCVICNGEVL